MAITRNAAITQISKANQAPSQQPAQQPTAQVPKQQPVSATQQQPAGAAQLQQAPQQKSAVTATNTGSGTTAATKSTNTAASATTPSLFERFVNALPMDEQRKKAWIAWWNQPSSLTPFRSFMLYTVVVNVVAIAINRVRVWVNSRHLATMPDRLGSEEVLHHYYIKALIAVQNAVNSKDKNGKPYIQVVKNGQELMVVDAARLPDTVLSLDGDRGMSFAGQQIDTSIVQRMLDLETDAADFDARTDDRYAADTAARNAYQLTLKAQKQLKGGLRQGDIDKLNLERTQLIAEEKAVAESVIVAFNKAPQVLAYVQELGKTQPHLLTLPILQGIAKILKLPAVQVPDVELMPADKKQADEGNKIAAQRAAEAAKAEVERAELLKAILVMKKLDPALASDLGLSAADEDNDEKRAAGDASALPLLPAMPKKARKILVGDIPVDESVRLTLLTPLTRAAELRKRIAGIDRQVLQLQGVPEEYSLQTRDDYVLSKQESFRDARIQIARDLIDSVTLTQKARRTWFPVPGDWAPTRAATANWLMGIIRFFGRLRTNSFMFTKKSGDVKMTLSLFWTAKLKQVGASMNDPKTGATYTHQPRWLTRKLMGYESRSLPLGIPQPAAQVLSDTERNLPAKLPPAAVEAARRSRKLFV